MATVPDGRPRARHSLVHSAPDEHRDQHHEPAGYPCEDRARDVLVEADRRHEVRQRVAQEPREETEHEPKERETHEGRLPSHVQRFGAGVRFGIKCSAGIGAYSDLSACTGTSLEALQAGSSPARAPTDVARAIASKMSSGVIAGVSVTELVAAAAPLVASPPPPREMSELKKPMMK